MAIAQQITRAEWLLMTADDDSFQAPWMATPDFQSRAVALLLNILRGYSRRLPQAWYLATQIDVVMSRRIIPTGLVLTPDLLVTPAEARPRRSWDMATEGRPPFLVAEVVTRQSESRDLKEKPLLYGEMGVQEYVIFQPLRRLGPKLGGYKRLPDGEWAPWPLDPAGQLHSDALGGVCLFVEEAGHEHWLRARDPLGNRLLSDEEAAVGAEKGIAVEKGTVTSKA